MVYVTMVYCILGVYTIILGFIWVWNVLNNMAYGRYIYSIYTYIIYIYIYMGGIKNLRLGGGG